MNRLQDRIRGSLIGGAIGDALGYPVEFINTFKGIQANYGERGITRLDTKWVESQNGKAVVSDDTQMTLFTANGLLNARQTGMAPKESIRQAYLEWFLTQTVQKSSNKHYCWISDVPELNVSRAPGNTCMSALQSIFHGGEAQNDSKGCGGVMRIAPIPLYAAVDSRMSIEVADVLSGDAAKTTHQHPLGFIPAALMSHIIYRLVCDSEPTCDRMKLYLREGVELIRKLYSAYSKDVETMADLSETVIFLLYNKKSDLENIERLGQGWTGEEALAIALYCAMKHFDSFEEAIIAAVNHGGDSDSTGAVCGNILGAAIGYDAIPKFYKDDLEMHDLILHMADDLYHGKVSKMTSQKKKEGFGIKALKMWSMGAGNSAKRFNGENPIPEKKEVATKESWKNMPMPDKNVVIPMKVEIPREAMQTIKYGHIPDAMEDHWFMYCDENSIRYYRSWTGMCIYIAKYVEEGDKCIITELQANRDPDQYRNTDNTHDVAHFMAMLTEEYGGDASEYWDVVYNG